MRYCLLILSCMYFIVLNFYLYIPICLFTDDFGPIFKFKLIKLNINRHITPI